MTEEPAALTPFQWVQILNILVMALLAIASALTGVAFFVFRTGHSRGERRRTVDMKLADLDVVEKKLVDLERLVREAGKRMSDKASEIQGFLSEAQLLLRELTSLAGDMRARMARVEHRHGNGESR